MTKKLPDEDPLTKPATDESSARAAEWMFDVLCCVVCRVKVVVTADRHGVQCPRCRRIYPIEDGIPQMLLESARQPAEAILSDTPLSGENE